MSDEHDNDPTPRPRLLRDEGDDAVPTPEFVADMLGRLRRELHRTIDGVTEVERLIREHGFDARTLAAIGETADLFEDRQHMWPGIARGLRRLVK